MSSLWKDLLFLHGHLVRKEDLDWRRDTRVEADPNKTDIRKRAHSLASTCCVAVWPRLSGPR
jgi:hypothetical protein